MKAQLKGHVYAAIACAAVSLLGTSTSTSLAAEPQRPRAQQPQNQQNMRFRAMDVNGDGRITRQEWRGNARSFRNHDWNGDGVLAGDEVRTGAVRNDTTDTEGFYNWTQAGFRAVNFREGRQFEGAPLEAGGEGRFCDAVRVRDAHRRGGRTRDRDRREVRAADVRIEHRDVVSEIL